ncbi:hypothetical protein GCM10022247_12250 [Allokutzneria multivorans]|uniref:Pentapeptide repeat-containing protein n=2 Tax=Allokutzneria multivorans TaxID=1142134 RepID=A0ABP7R943_9PSEU
MESTRDNRVMETWVWFGCGGACLLAALAFFVVHRRRRETSPAKYAPMLTTTIFGAAAAMCVVVGWLIATDPYVNRTEALKTGGLASGSIVALYALWLNDRRRRTDESRQVVEEDRQKLEHERQELERLRTEHEREKTADERFARGIELLGHEADQVRVGALHALAGLARSHPHRTQTVVDILCSYLRRPFDHPRYRDLRHRYRSETEVPTDYEPDDSEFSSDPGVDRERQVRMAAQRLIGDALHNQPGCTLDLTGAVLDHLALPSAQLGTLTLRGAQVYGDTTFDGCQFSGDVDLGRSHVWGPISFSGTKFHGELRAVEAEFWDTPVFFGISAAKYVDMQRSHFHHGVLFDESTIATLVLADATIGDELIGLQDVELTNRDNRVQLPWGWNAVVDHNGKVTRVDPPTDEPPDDSLIPFG